MGLQRKQGVPIQEGQQFDLGGTMDEFRQSIGMYMFWKPGMDIMFHKLDWEDISSSGKRVFTKDL